MKIVIKLLITTASVLISSYLIPGVSVDALTTALLVAIVLGGLNMFVKPIIVFFTLPITVMTLGLFYVLINIGLLFLTSWIVPGFTIDTFLSALVFSIAMSVVGAVLDRFYK